MVDDSMDSELMAPELDLTWKRRPDDTHPKRENNETYHFMRKPSLVLCDPSISTDAKEIYELIRTRDFNPSGAWVSLAQETMAAILGISLDRVKRAIKELTTARLLQKNQRRGEAGKHCEYKPTSLQIVYGRVSQKFILSNEENAGYWKLIDAAAKRHDDFTQDIKCFLKQSEKRYTSKAEVQNHSTENRLTIKPSILQPMERASPHQE